MCDHLPQRLGVVVDTGQLIAALHLARELRLNSPLTPWAPLKLVLLPLYVLLGLLTFRYARKRGARTVFFVAALVCYGLLIAVALTHMPPGGLRRVGL